MGEMVEIATLDGTARFQGYCAEPQASARGAVVVIQEIFGLNENMRRTTDAWADRGFLAVAPDLFWRIRPGIQLDPQVPSEMSEALSLIGRFDTDKGVADMEATIRWAREAVGGAGVGVVGYCLGGRMAYLAATRTDADASIGYYGAGIDKMLAEDRAIARPLMLHFGEEDDHIPVDGAFRIREALAGNPHVSVHTYADAGHGFAAAIGQRRNDQAAREADARTAELLAQTLR